jgi:hypothetical protein
MRLFITFSVLFLCLNINAQKEKYFASKWRDIDAEPNGPALSDYIPSEKGEVLYCLSNDDKNIYVDVIITESINQNKLLQMGMTVWINEDGKARKITGIRYPIGAQYSRGQTRGREAENSLVKVSPLSQANTIELVGYKSVKPTRFSSNNTDNIRGSVKYDKDGNLLCSMIIPDSKLPSGVVSESIPLTLAIEYGAPPKIEESSGMSAYSGGSGMPGGGRSGGGSRGGAPGGGAAGGSTSTQKTPKPVIFWMKNITLAEKK